MPASPGEHQSLVTRARRQLLDPAALQAGAPEGIAPWLWRSWRRCLEQGRSPAEKLEFAALAPHVLRELQEQHQALLLAARPVMAQLAAAVGAMRCFSLLTDAAGRVLEVEGLADRHDRRALAVGRVGVDLSERSAGTSAIGAALTELSPVWLHRQEHFFDALRDYSCAGAPIFDMQGLCLGMLDITGIDVPERPELQHLALRCARAIEDRLLRALPHAVLLHLNWPGSPLGQEGEGLMAFDAEGGVLGGNSVARQLVPRPPQPPGERRPMHSQELLALPWADLVAHARQRPQMLMALPLWSGLRLQAFAQAGPQLQAPLIASPMPLRASEQLLIQQALHEAQGNVSQAAKSLGLSRATLYRRLAGKRKPPGSSAPPDLP